MRHSGDKEVTAKIYILNRRNPGCVLDSHRRMKNGLNYHMMIPAVTGYPYEIRTSFDESLYSFPLAPFERQIQWPIVVAVQKINVGLSFGEELDDFHISHCSSVM